MSFFEHPEFSGHEHVSYFHDAQTGLRAIIAIHSTRGTVAGGGIRFFPYANSDEALEDVLRLSKGMTYKSVLAGLPFGRGKSVIIGDPATMKTEALLEAFGRCVARLGGKYICAEDIGMTPSDMDVIHRVTPFVTGLPGKSGDTSPLTGYGVHLGAVLNDSTIPGVRARIVCGGANNQLANVDRHGRMLADRGVLFVPDYIANAGGVISGSSEVTNRPEADTRRMVEGIYDTCLKVFDLADERACTPLEAAGGLAVEILGERRLA
jgi:glutamate dehydrogenase/leucine dehydrogenase